MTARQLREAILQELKECLDKLMVEEPVGGVGGDGFLRERVLAVMEDCPQSGKRIAKLCEHKCDSHFRGVLSHLVDEGKVRHTSQGYSRQLP